MFVAGIDVWLGSNAHDPVEVVDINMNKNSVEPSQNLLTLWLETLRERDICCDWKQLKKTRDEWIWPEMTIYNKI